MRAWGPTCWWHPQKHDGLCNIVYIVWLSRLCKSVRLQPFLQIACLVWGAFMLDKHVGQHTQLPYIRISPTCSSPCTFIVRPKIASWHDAGSCDMNWWDKPYFNRLSNVSCSRVIWTAFAHSSVCRLYSPTHKILTTVWRMQFLHSTLVCDVCTGLFLEFDDQG